jgi:hypothetical protein
MEIISIEKKTFEAMMTRFEMFAQKVQTLCQRHGEKKMKKWYDNQDVCLILRISPRTLQTLRDNGTLGYTQINHKMFYKPEDVQAAITTVEEKRKIKENKLIKQQFN